MEAGFPGETGTVFSAFARGSSGASKNARYSQHSRLQRVKSRSFSINSVIHAEKPPTTPK